MTYLLAARAFLSRAPWQIYAALGIVLAVWLYGNHRYDAGRESVLAELRAKEAEAKANAWEIAATEGAKGAERAAEFEAKQETLRDAIQNAEKANRNALDEIF